jgi:hypothetical protein
MPEAPPDQISTLSHVAIAKGDDYVMASLEDFLALPLDQRVGLILEQRLRFYDGRGALISTAEGLKLLKRMRQAGVPALR